MLQGAICREFNASRFKNHRLMPWIVDFLDLRSLPMCLIVHVRLSFMAP